MNEDCTFSERHDLFIDKSPLSRYEVINVGNVADEKKKSHRKDRSSFLFCPI